MLKNRTVLEIEVKGRDYRFECSPDSPLTDIQEALAILNQYVVSRLQAPEEKPEEVKEDQ